MRSHPFPSSIETMLSIIPHLQPSCSGSWGTCYVCCRTLNARNFTQALSSWLLTCCRPSSSDTRLSASNTSWNLSEPVEVIFYVVIQQYIICVNRLMIYGDFFTLVVRILLSGTTLNDENMVLSYFYFVINIAMSCDKTHSLTN